MLILLRLNVFFFSFREKSELTKAAAALQREKDAHEAHRQQQQQVQQPSNIHQVNSEALGGWGRFRLHAT